VAVAARRAPHPHRIRHLFAALLCLDLLSVGAAQAAPTMVAPMNPVAAGIFIAGLTLLPTDVGTLIRNDAPDFVLGWSWQFPFTANDRHRALIGVDWIPTASDHHVRARAGYCYAVGHLITGLAAAISGGDPTWSPEIGVRIGEPRHGTLHLLARAEVGFRVDSFQGVALLAGWGIL